jgi:hypothetical protein
MQLTSITLPIFAESREPEEEEEEEEEEIVISPARRPTRISLVTPGTVSSPEDLAEVQEKKKETCTAARVKLLNKI